MNLYLVTITKPRNFYVIAKDSTSAYKIVKRFLDKEDWFFAVDREYLRVEQIGSTQKYGDNYTLVLGVTRGIIESDEARKAKAPDALPTPPEYHGEEQTPS